MKRVESIAVVIAVFAGIIALGLVPVMGRWEATPLRRRLRWVALLSFAVLGVLIVVYLVLV